MSDEQVVIYTDGACVGNPGHGGWAAILAWGDHQRELTAGLRNTTNNRMELLAAISALEALKRPCNVVIYTDSEYVRRGISEWVQGWVRKGWKTASKQPVKNVDLWKRLLRAVERHTSAPACGVEWRWVKGHAGTALNERADEMATASAHTVTDADPEDVREPVGQAGLI